jgi:hypothetical protein
MSTPSEARRILEVQYRPKAFWAAPIRQAIEGNARLAERDQAWRGSPLSDRAFAIETRLTYLPQIITFLDDNLQELGGELRRGNSAGTAASHLRRGEAFTFNSDKVVQRVLFAVTALITESRSCFENLAEFYRLFLQLYCTRTISEKESYDVVARASGDSAWSDDLRRIRGDLIHERSVFLAFDISSDGWPPIFSMNWRPGHFGPSDRIDLITLRDIWQGLHRSARAMQAKIAEIANQQAS